MKKARLFTLLTLMIMLALLTVGCKKKDTVSSVALKDHDASSVIETEMGAFDFSAYELTVSYKSGDTKDIPLSEDMIADSDQVKFYQVGEHDITVSYEGQTYTFKISVKRSSFKDLSFPQNNVFTYDGKAHTVELQGHVPANAVVTYPNGNSFVNAGTYDVIAVVTCDGYVTRKLSTTVIIERATHDMSGVTFDAREYVYDGTAHSVKISGTLPEGVAEPMYTIDEKKTSSAIDVGEYTVRATFSNRDPNYENIPAMTTTLTITPAELTVQSVDLVFKNEGGKAIDGESKFYDGKSVTFDISDYSKLSKKISVSFTVYDQSEQVIATSNSHTGIKNAGVYTVKVDFTPTDSKNYKPIEPIIFKFEVVKADYPPLDGIQFVSQKTVFDGKAHKIGIGGTLPSDVKVSYQYYLDGVLVTDSDGTPSQSVTNAGRYIVQAKFTHTDKNRKPIPDMSATLNIDKIKVDAFMVGFSIDHSVEYNGMPFEPTFITWKEANATDYDIMNYGTVECYMLDDLGEYVKMAENELPTEIGSYRYAMMVSIAKEHEGNYTLSGGEASQIISVDFDIQKKNIELPKVTFTSESEMLYTGEYQEIAFTCTADEALVTVSKTYFKMDSSSKYVNMGDGELPTDKGAYRCVVTVSVKDAQHTAFSNDESSAEFFFDFLIQ